MLALIPATSPLHAALQAIIAAHMSQQLGAQMAAAGGLGGPAVAALLNLQMQRQKVGGCQYCVSTTQGLREYAQQVFAQVASHPCLTAAR
jgi:hypothetical protein